MDASHYHIAFKSILFNRWLFPVSCYYKQSKLKTLMHHLGLWLPIRLWDSFFAQISIHSQRLLPKITGNEGIQQTTWQMVFYMSIRGVKLYLTKLNGQLHAELDWLFPLIYLIYYQSHGLNNWCSFLSTLCCLYYFPLSFFYIKILQKKRHMQNKHTKCKW